MLWLIYALQEHHGRDVRYWPALHVTPMWLLKLSLSSSCFTVHAQVISSGSLLVSDGWCVHSGCPHAGIRPDVASASTIVPFSGCPLYTAGCDFISHHQRWGAIGIIRNWRKYTSSALVDCCGLSFFKKWAVFITINSPKRDYAIGIFLSYALTLHTEITCEGIWILDITRIGRKHTSLALMDSCHWDCWVLHCPASPEVTFAGHRHGFWDTQCSYTSGNSVGMFFYDWHFWWHDLYMPEARPVFSSCNLLGF